MQNGHNVPKLFLIAPDTLKIDQEDLRKLYLEFFKNIKRLGWLCSNHTEESLSEIRVYTQQIATSFSDSYRLTPDNVFQVSKDRVKQREAEFLEDIFLSPTRVLELSFNKLDEGQGEELKFLKLPFALPGNRAGEQQSTLCAGKVTSGPVFKSYELSDDVVEANYKTGELLPRDKFLSNFGYEVLGPIFCGYGLWVLEQNPQAKFVGIMRDGNFLLKVVSILGGEDNGKLFVNRLTSTKAVLADPSDTEAMTNFLIRSRTIPITLEKVIEALGISRNTPFPFALSTKVDMNSLPGLISWLNQKDVKEQWVASCTKVQEGLLKHCRKFYEQNSENVVLLDVGYAGNILANLSKIFSRNKLNTKIIGNFLLTSVGAIWAQNRGCNITGFLAQNGTPLSFAKTYFRTPELFELCCTVPEGTTLGYRTDGEPIKGQAPFHSEQYAMINQVQHSVLDFITDWKETVGYSPELKFNKKEVDAWQVKARYALIRLLLRPSLSEATHLGHWIYDSNLGIEDKRSLVEYRIFSPSTNDIATRRGSVYWPGARMVLNQHA